MALPSMRPEMTSGHRLRNAAFAFVALALPGALTLTFVEVRGSLRRQSEEITETGGNVAGTLGHELVLREYMVETMVASAEQMLDERVKPAIEVVDHLVAEPKHGGFRMRVPPGHDPSTLGSLMGEGAIPERGSAAAREMAMAFSLTPGFQLMHSRGLDVPWAYFVSRRGFLYLFPHVGDGEFPWSHDLLARYEPGPGNAPLRVSGPRMGWSSMYVDKAGKGLMTTLSKLVVHDGQIVGDVSIDVSMNNLTAMVDRHGQPDTTMHLLDADGRDMLERPMPMLDLATAPRSRPFAMGELEVVVFDVAPTRWHLAVATPRRAMLRRALVESSVYGLMVLFMLGSFVLVVALSRALRSLAEVSVRDPLTGLYNRRHFDDVVEVELARARRARSNLCLAIIDVDHFKKYNDRYGHQAGDRVLRAVAEALRGSLRRAGDHLFRIGGEEFAVVAPVERLDQLQMLGDKLCAAVRAVDIPHEGSPIGRVTISMGSALVDHGEALDVDSAYQRADAALYRAKEAGRDRVVVA